MHRHVEPKGVSIVRRRNFLILAIFMLAGCASFQPTNAPAPNIYIMRHLNTPQGAVDPDLTPQGMATAVALAQWISRDPPSVIFVSNTKRAKQTAAPTAARYGVSPTLYDPRDTPGLVTSVLAQRGTVLIVGHSNTVPDIIAALGGERPEPLVHEDFGDIWHLEGPERTAIRVKLP
jgi:broad specificity phosphatase PhoE